MKIFLLLVVCATCASAIDLYTFKTPGSKSSFVYEVPQSVYDSLDNETLAFFAKLNTIKHPSQRNELAELRCEDYFVFTATSYQCKTPGSDLIVVDVDHHRRDEDRKQGQYFEAHLGDFLRFSFPIDRLSKVPQFERLEHTCRAQSWRLEGVHQNYARWDHVLKFNVAYPTYPRCDDDVLTRTHPPCRSYLSMHTIPRGLSAEESGLSKERYEAVLDNVGVGEVRNASYLDDAWKIAQCGSFSDEELSVPVDKNRFLSLDEYIYEVCKTAHQYKNPAHETSVRDAVRKLVLMTFDFMDFAISMLLLVSMAGVVMGIIFCVWRL